MNLKNVRAVGLVCALFWAGLSYAATPAVDPYEQYVKTSKDFKPVRQDREMLLKAFPSWTYMPWTAHWTIGYNDASGKWATDHGYNGAFVVRDNVDEGKSRTGRLDWINKHKLHFYADHAAGKGYLHLWDGGAELKANLPNRAGASSVRDLGSWSFHIRGMGFQPMLAI